MNIEIWAIDRLTPYSRNARKIPQKAIDKVAASLKEFGWRQPIVVDSEGVIVVGHARLLAAKKLGMTEVPVHIATGLTPAQIKAYRLMDNRSHEEASWDEGLLSLEMMDLQTIGGADLLEFTGFDEPQINAAIGRVSTVNYPTLRDGDRQPFQQITFTLHDTQVDLVKAAIAAASQLGPYAGTSNENSNGNGIARVCEMFLDQHAQS